MDEIKTNLNNTDETENLIEAILFYKGEPVKISELSKILNQKEEAIQEALNNLEIKLSNRGIRLSKKDDLVVLVTSQESSNFIEKIRKEDLTKDLSKAALETLSIIIYRSPIKRSEIDFVRGVNSQFILRLLSIRGLIEKYINPHDERGFLYKPTFELLNLLGINKIEDYPDFEKVNQEIEEFLNRKDETNK